MAGYGLKDANRTLRERKDAKPRATYCGDCGEECDGLLCDDCAYSVETRWTPVSDAAAR